MSKILTLLLALLAGRAFGDATLRARRLEMLARGVPPGLDQSRAKTTSRVQVTYRALTPDGAPVFGILHDWEFRVVRVGDGTPVTGAHIEVAASMPQHGHGSATEPVIRELGRGYYRAEGLRFQMPGWWSVAVSAGDDEVTFDFLSPDAADPQGEHERVVRSLTLAALPKRPIPDAKAARLGAMLFHDRGLSRSGEVACSTCHLPQKAFASSRLVPGEDGAPRSVPSLMGVAWQPWFFWDGRKDSLWSQALAPLANPLEHDLTPAEAERYVAQRYHQRLTFAGIGKAIAAFEQTLVPKPAAFDRHAAAHDFAPCEARGLAVFTGKGRCVSCHNGPLFRNDYFHNTGLSAVANGHAQGRARGIERYLQDPYACPACGREQALARTNAVSFNGAFKTPSLRDVARTAPYMHDGRFATLADVIEHYDQAQPGPDGDTELAPLHLTREEKTGLECFLRTLSAD